MNAGTAKIPGKLTTRIVEYLRKNPESTAHTVRMHVNASVQQINQTLYRLYNAGHIESEFMRPGLRSVGDKAPELVRHYWVNKPL